MRVAVLYNRDVYALKALNRLLPALTQHTLQLFHSSRVGRKSPSQGAELVSLAAAEQDLLSHFGARLASEQRLGFDDLGAHFALSDAPLNNVNQPAGLETLRRFNPDLMVSIRFGKILRDPAIACAPLGVINLHSGLLPYYRGVMPTFWAMLAGETQIGMTLHWVPDATIDTGATIATTAQSCDLQSSYMSNVWHLYDAGVDLMLRAIAAIENGELKKDSAPGDSSGGQYFSFPGTSALTAFHEQGLQLYNSADQLLAGVR